MATNRAAVRGRYLTVNVGSGKKSGDPVCVGQLAGVCLNDADALTPYTSVIDTEGVYNLLVDGIDQGGNSAVAVGDIIYWVVGNTPQLSKVNTGVRFGYALDPVVSGVHTTTIRVKLGFS